MIVGIFHLYLNIKNLLSRDNFNTFGEDARLEQAMNYVKLAKEAKLPEVRTF
ncbi:unnamed protein product, partial [marine sediment metagenome]